MNNKVVAILVNRDGFRKRVVLNELVAITIHPIRGRVGEYMGYEAVRFYLRKHSRNSKFAIYDQF